MNATYAIVLARKHMTDNPAAEYSARLCVADAVGAYHDGAFADALRRSLDSLRHSVGVFHPAYEIVAAEIERRETDE